jgi:hypothetical protein
MSEYWRIKLIIIVIVILTPLVVYSLSYFASMGWHAHKIKFIKKLDKTMKQLDKAKTINQDKLDKTINQDKQA